MNKTNLLILSIIILMSILTSCNPKVEDSQLTVLNNLYESKRELEQELNTKTELLLRQQKQIDKYVSELEKSNDKIEKFGSRFKEEQSKINELNDKNSYLQKVLEGYHNIPNAYIDLINNSDYKQIEVTDNLNKEWQDILGNYLRYIPDFKNVNELSDIDLLETAIRLYVNYDFSFIEQDKTLDFIPKEHLESIVEKVFGTTVKKPESTGLFKDDRYYYGGSSYHGYFISNILSLYKKEDIYHIIVDRYFIDELSEKSYDDYLEMIKNGDAYINSTYKIILKKDTTQGEEIFKVIYKETIGEYGFYYN